MAATERPGRRLLAGVALACAVVTTAAGTAGCSGGDSGGTARGARAAAGSAGDRAGATPTPAATPAAPKTAAATPAATPPTGSDARAGCPGVAPPPGFGITAGLPHPLQAPYSPVTLPNPQSIANEVLAAVSSPAVPQASRRCLAELGGLSLMRHSSVRQVATADGRDAGIARFFPYGFAFSANPSVAELRPGWVSGIAQGSALLAFAALYRLTSDDGWLTVGREVLRSFEVSRADGGITSHEHGLTWYQEYPTKPESDVLNGHLAAVIALYQWADLTHDPQATRLADEGRTAARALLPRFEVELPQGLLTSYDLLRGRTGAASLRLASDQATASTPGTRHPAQPGASPTRAGAAPTTASAQVQGSPGRPQHGPGPVVTVPVTPLRYLSDNLAGPGPDQVIPPDRLVPGGRYRLTFRARVVTTAGTVPPSGSVQVTASCPQGLVPRRGLATIRTATWRGYDVGIGLPPGRCGLRMHFSLAAGSRTSPARTSATGSSAGGGSTTGTAAAETVGLGSSGARLDVEAVRLYEVVPPIAGRGTVPVPLSVVEDPDVTLAVTYRGHGLLEAWSEGHWVVLRDLPESSSPRVVSVPLPAWAQGRTLNWDYHRLQTAQVAWISSHHSGGDPFWAEHGRRWQQLAPEVDLSLFG